MKTEKIYELIIIGTGPAGITAGIYAYRKNLDFLIIASERGGQVSKAFLVENYPGFPEISGINLADKFLTHLKKFNINPIEKEITKIEKHEGIFKLTSDNAEIYKSKSVLITSGSKPRILKVKGEKEFLGKGVSYCVTCDGPLFKNKKVAVIGGGNSGFGAAQWLSDYCSKVYIFESNEKSSADEKIQKEVTDVGVEIITSANIIEIKGEKFVETLLFEMGPTKSQKEIEVDGVFIEIGYIPTSSFVNSLADFNKFGEIKVDLSTFQTKTPGLFAAGDVIEFPFKQIVIAAGQGSSAALSAYKFLKNSV